MKIEYLEEAYKIKKRIEYREIWIKRLQKKVHFVLTHDEEEIPLEDTDLEELKADIIQYIEEDILRMNRQLQHLLDEK